MRLLLALLVFILSLPAQAITPTPRLSGEETIVAVPADGFVEIAREYVLKDKRGRFVYCAELQAPKSLVGKKECKRFVSAAGFVRLQTSNPEAVYVAMGLRRSVSEQEERVVLFYRIP